MEHTHKIGTEEIRVKKHHNCIGVLPLSHNTDEPVQSVPANVVIEILNENVYEYLQNRKHKDISSLAEELNANIEWSNSKREITVSLSLSTADRNFKNVSKSWKNDILKLDTFIQAYKEKYVPSPQQPKGIKTEIQQYISDQGRHCRAKDVSILVEKHTIHIIGLATLVDDLSQQCEEVNFEVLIFK